MFLYAIIFGPIIIVSVNAIDNFQTTKCNLNCLKNENSNHESKETGQIWKIWEMARDACITKDYLAYEQPKMDEPVSLYAGDDNTSVLNINERKKTFEVALILELTWVDDRIKVDFSGSNDKRRLPSIKKNVQPYIWIPWFEIINKKELKYVYDPNILVFVQIISGMNMNRQFIKGQFDSNATLIRAWIQWHVTVPCNFDFSNYPLDAQNCEFRMIFSDVNLTFFDRRTDSGFPAQKYTEMEGFRITTTFAGTRHFEIDSFPNSAFGFDLKIKRIIQPYVMQYYAPCFAIVMVSGLSFVVPLSATPGRIGLVVTQFLTLTTIYIHQKVKM